ncbi:MAG: hypothetical protein ACWGMZ_08390 [Thermoguttaceae bacterium]
MCKETESAEMKSFEAALAALTPRTDRLDRERLMFLAGQQSILPSPDQSTRLRPVPVGARREAGGEGTFWKAGFAAMTAVATVLLVIVLRSPSERLDPQKIEKPSVRSIVSRDAPMERRRLAELNQENYNDIIASNFPLLKYFAKGKQEPSGPSRSYPALLRQVLAHGIDSWQPETSGAVDIKATNTRPQTSREILKQYLARPDMFAG